MRLIRHLEGVHIAPAIILLVATRQGIHPYIDPGTGSIVLQAVIGALVGGLVAMKLFWNHIKAFFRKLLRIGTKHGEGEDAPK